MKHFPKIEPALLALSITLSTPLSAAKLEVDIQGVRNPSGQVKLMLFEREDGFRKEEKARQVLTVPATAGTVSSVFNGLPNGRYAVIAYHDENSDGRLNLRFGMFPLEGYGLSNNPKLSGPPKFKDGAFEVGETGSRIAIRLDY